MSDIKRNFSKFSKKATSYAIITAAMFGSQLLLAVDNGPTQTGEICMQKVFGSPVNNSNRLNCTANDIRLSKAVSVYPSSCLEGTQFTLTATFEVDVTANARYDAGFFFRIDGGDNARGDGTNATGKCSLSALSPSLAPALDLDGDTCGDLNSGNYQVTFTIPGVQCVGTPDPDHPGQKILKLPNCTSWHNKQGTVCNIDSAFDFNPDTKSKCVCDDDFTVPVIVETANLKVNKTATPTSVPETGGEVTYNVEIVNDATYVSVTIDSILDDIYGNVGDANNSNVTMNTCPSKVGLLLGPGESTSCSFKAFVSGNANDTVTDVVKVCSTQGNTGDEICGNDDASVVITDVPAIPAVKKTALSSSCKVDVKYQVVVSNNSVVNDTITVDALTDDKFGDLTQVHGNVISTTCAAGNVINKGGNYTCEFVGRVDTGTGPCNIDHTNTVTSNVTDDDGKSYAPTDSATVKVNTTFP